MRRFIAYIMMAVSMLIAIGVAATPVLTKLNGGREFNSGREIVFNIDAKDENEVTQEGADKVAKEMRTRLDNWHIEDYSVKVQTNKAEDAKYTVAVSINVEKDIFNYVAKYLCFDGGNFSLTGPDSTNLIENPFKLDEAEVIYESDLVPVIVIPVTDDGKTGLEKLIEQLDKTEEGEGGTPLKSHRITRAGELPVAGEGEGGEGGQDTPKTPNIYMWANYEEGDEPAKSQTNPYVGEKIIMSFFSSSIWYEKDGEEHNRIQFICGEANENGEYDFTKLKDANTQANYYINMIKASAYDYEVTCPTRNVSSAGIDYYDNTLEVAPSMESLLSLGNNVTIKMSTTLIATIIAFVIISILLVVYYRINAIAIIVTTLGTLFVTLLSFSSMTVLFNLPALIGLLILATGTLFSEIVYVNRFKEEVYKGRSLKKANQEASKKSNLLALDAAVILAFSGLMMYALGGTALKPMGVVLFFGAVFGLLMNLIVFKLLMYLVTNSTNLQHKYNVFNIEASKVPNLMDQEEKEPYQNTYEKVDFTKRKKVASIILGALTVAAIAVITVFGVKDGSPLNVANATKDTTVIYTSIRSDNGGLISDAETFRTYALKDVKSDENTSVDAAKFDVEMKKVATYVYDENDPEIGEELYFISKIGNTYNKDQLANVETSIVNALEEIIPGKYELSVQTSKELNYTPDQRYVALATSIAIVGCAFYIALRYRPSRGIASLVVSGGSTAIAYGLFVGIRVGTTAVTSLAMPIVAVSTLLISLFYFSTEKAMLKENHGDLSFEERKDIMIKALGKAASPMLILILVAAYMSVNYFGFGISQTAFLFASALVGQIVAAVAILVIMGPLACEIGKWFSKINMPKIKLHKENNNVQRKRNSSEPEETIFIGIND